MHLVCEMNYPVKILLIIGFGLMLSAVAAQATETEHRLGQGVSLAVGIGVEVSHGDYDVDADATMVTLPVLIVANPVENIDLTFEVPLVYLSSRSDSGVVVTQSGSAGGGVSTQSKGNGHQRGAGATSPAATTPVAPTGTTTTTVTSSKTVSDSGVGDISLSAGWTVLHDSDRTPRIRPTLYLKVPTGDDERGLGTGTFEGGPGLFISKWLGNWQFFAEGSYIFQDSTSSYPGENYVSYGVGGGVQTTDRLFVSLYATGSSAMVEDGTSPGEGWLKLNFLQSRRISWEAYAFAGFTDASPDTGGGLLMMYQF